MDTKKKSFINYNKASGIYEKSKIKKGGESQNHVR